MLSTVLRPSNYLTRVLKFGKPIFYVRSISRRNLESRDKCNLPTKQSLKFLIFVLAYLRSFITRSFPSEVSTSLKTAEIMKDDEVFQNSIDLENEERKTVEDNAGCQKRKQVEIENKKVKKTKKSLRPGFGEDRFSETEYYFENGLRKVYPYYFSYTTYCKGRWVGQLLFDVLLKEFGAYTKEQFEQFIKLGTLTINKQPVSKDYVLKNNDLVTNVIHRHETPVLAAPLKIIHKSDDLIVLDKPPSIPVHPCGRYRHNSVTFLLGKEHNLQNLHTIHRLDRLTSGLLMFGLNPTIAKKLVDQIKERKVQKEYLCRVEGNFPEETVTCIEPLEVLAPKIGICAVDPDGKECTTVFKKICYNGKSSVVLCKPLTGRTHQIRVHLQYLGYPIVNDPLYNNEVFGPNKGKGGEFGKSREELIKLITDTHTIGKWLGEDSDSGGNGVLPPSELKDVNSTEDMKSSRIFVKNDTTGNDISSTSKSSVSKPLETCPLSSQLSHYTDSDDFLKLAEKYQFNANKVNKDSSCVFCKLNCRDPKAQDLIMFLHAYRYSGEGFDFQTKVPRWATEEWNEN